MFLVFIINFSVGAIEPKFYNVLLEKLETTEAHLPHFDDFDQLKEKLAEIFLQKTRDEWSDIFGKELLIKIIQPIVNYFSWN